MPKPGHIIIIEDDQDDTEILTEIMSQLNVENKIICFDNCDEAFAYLRKSKDSIFFIISDINLPKKTGLELKHDIDKDPVLRKKSIPFILYSTAAIAKDVDDAYANLNIQGFFKKECDYNLIKKNIKIILDYWSVCLKPGLY